MSLMWPWIACSMHCYSHTLRKRTERCLATGAKLSVVNKQGLSPLHICAFQVPCTFRALALSCLSVGHISH